jgi:hypothetical protein
MPTKNLTCEPPNTPVDQIERFYRAIAAVAGDGD